MRKLAAILEHETEDLATLITLEMGKPLEASRLEILKCADACRYFADNAARILAHESIPTEHYSYVRWDPLGIILAVMPWNFPFWQVFRFLAPPSWPATSPCSSTPPVSPNAPWPSNPSSAAQDSPAAPSNPFSSKSIRSKPSSPTRASPPSPSPAAKSPAAPSEPRPDGSSKNPSSN